MIVAGFGFTSRATTASLLQALDATGVAPGRISRIATAHDKATHPAIVDFAQAQGWHIEAIHPQPLEAATTETQSPISHAQRGTGSVAEAAAMAAAGPAASLIVSRKTSQDRMATCAIAQGPDT